MKSFPEAKDQILSAISRTLKFKVEENRRVTENLGQQNKLLNFLKINKVSHTTPHGKGTWATTYSGLCINGNGGLVRSVGSGSIDVTLSACQAYCAAEEGCEAFSYFAQGQVCHLRGTMVGPASWNTNELHAGPVVGGDGQAGKLCYIKPTGLAQRCTTPTPPHCTTVH